jgi:hypothetical protein
MPTMVFADLYNGCSAAWVHDSYRWRGKLLLGRYAHWCDNWDGLPIDETCLEWPCGCSLADED